MICFVRVDDRLIHGQVQTSWISLSKAKNILVIDDTVASDDVAKQILQFATPNGMKLKVLNVEEAITFWPKAMASANNIMVLFKTIKSVERFAKAGISLPEIMIGPSSYREGSKEIIQSTYFKDDEIEAAKHLHAFGVTLFFQHTPDQKKVYWTELKL